MLEITERDDEKLVVYVETDEIIEYRSELVKYTRIFKCTSMHGHNYPTLTGTGMYSMMDFKFESKEGYLGFIKRIEKIGACNKV